MTERDPIFDALQALPRSAFGKPTVGVMSAAVGRKVTAKERDTAFDKLPATDDRPAASGGGDVQPFTTLITAPPRMVCRALNRFFGNGDFARDYLTREVFAAVHIEELTDAVKAIPDALNSAYAVAHQLQLRGGSAGVYKLHSAGLLPIALAHRDDDNSLHIVTVALHNSRAVTATCQIPPRSFDSRSVCF